MTAAADIAAALGGSYRSGSWWRCRCPVHNSGSATLALRDAGGGIEMQCFAGCGSNAVLAELRRRGLASANTGSPPDPEMVERQRKADARDRVRRINAARSIWQGTTPANYIIDAYLGGRLILAPTPETIRFHPSLRHRETGARRPAMVAMVDHATEGFVGVHCTYLASDGSCKASLDPVKRCIGPVGGGAVRLAPAAATLAIAEGIETALSYMEATGTPTWAALSASGIRKLILPDMVTEVIIAADPDPVGLMAARAAAGRWLAEGRRVSIARPPVGLDFNDLARVALG